LGVKCIQEIKGILTDDEWAILHSAFQPYIELLDIVPRESSLPTLSNELSELAKAIPIAIGYNTDSCILSELDTQFIRLGGKFSTMKSAAFDFGVEQNSTNDWTWFFQQVKLGETGADQIWREIMDSI